MNDTTTERQRRKRAVGLIPARPAVTGAPKPAAGWRRRWGGLIFLAVLAGLLAFCHGCHGDIDDELLALGWWLVGASF